MFRGGFRVDLSTRMLFYLVFRVFLSYYHGLLWQ